MSHHLAVSLLGLFGIVFALAFLGFAHRCLSLPADAARTYQTPRARRWS